MDIKFADYGQNTHRHVALIYDEPTPEGVIGITSPSIENGHTHLILYVPPAPEQIDPSTGQLIVPAADGFYAVQEVDGHTHPLSPIPNYLKDGFTAEEEEEYRRVAVNLHQDILSLESQYLKNAQLADEFVMGVQWDRDIARRRQSMGKSVITINNLARPINVLHGIFSQNQTDIVFKPNDGGDDLQADVLNELTKILLERCDYTEAEMDVVLDMIITGRGNFNVRIDTSNNVEGDIIVERVPFDSALYGAHQKKTIEDCQAVMITEWMSRQELRSVVPKDKRGLIDKTRFFSFEDEYYYNRSTDSDNIGVTGKQVRYDVSHKDEFKDWLDVAAKKIKVINIQFLDSYEVMNYVHPSGFVFSINDDMPKDVKSELDYGLLSFGEFEQIVEDQKRTINARIACDYILLGIVSTPGRLITLAPAYATKRKNKIKSPVLDSLDLCRQNNWLNSKMMDIVKTMAGRNFIYDGDTFSDQKEIDDFTRNASEDGALLKVANINRPPQKLDDIRFPVDIANQIAIVEKNFMAVFGLSEELLGLAQGGNSARLFENKKNTSLLGVQYLIDGLSTAKKIVGRLLLKLYPMVYSGERVYRILRNREEMFDIRIGNRTLKEYTEDEIKRIWEAIPNADYDITVSEAKYSKTKRDRDIEMLATLASQGVAGIDGRSLLELWDLPPNIKEQLLSYANQNAQMAQEIESQKLQVAEKQQMIAAQSKVQVKAAELAQKDALERDKLAQKDKVDTANIDLKLIEINAKAATDLGKIKNSSN